MIVSCSTEVLAMKNVYVRLLYIVCVSILWLSPQQHWTRIGTYIFVNIDEKADVFMKERSNGDHAETIKWWMWIVAIMYFVPDCVSKR